MGFIRFRYFRLLFGVLGAIILFTTFLAVAESISRGIWVNKGVVSDSYSWFYGNSMEEIKNVPPWFWWIAIAVITIILSGLVGVIIFFLTRYVNSNDENWKEIRGHMNTMINTISLLGHRTGENEKDIDRIDAVLNGRQNIPFVKQRHQ